MPKRAKKRRVAVAINLAEPYRHHLNVFAGIQRYAQECGAWEITADPFAQLARRRGEPANYDGVIARASRELVRQAADTGIPLVNVWTGAPTKTLVSVLPDQRACGRMAAEHLLHRGYQRFAFQGFTRHGGTRGAEAGFLAALRAAGCSCSSQLVSPIADESMKSWRPYMAALKDWIATWKPPLAVLVIQDIFGRYLANACLQAGLRIPDDVALISFGNEPLICTRPEPSLTSIDLNHDRIGYEAAALLDRLMAGKRPPKAPLLIEPKELVTRRSTDSFAVDHPIVRQALTFISEHSHEGIHVNDVAKHVHATVRTLERHFSATLGRTMTEEIARLRLERATRLMVESDNPIKIVARTCGYNSGNYFHDVFFKAHGMTPGEYRRRRRG